MPVCPKITPQLSTFQNQPQWCYTKPPLKHQQEGVSQNNSKHKPLSICKTTLNIPMGVHKNFKTKDHLRIFQNPLKIKHPYRCFVKLPQNETSAGILQNHPQK